MQQNQLRLALLATGLCTLAACSPSTEPAATGDAAPAQAEASAPPAQGITPQPISAGYDFPGVRADIQAWADAWEIDKITAKGWNLWAGLNADSGQSVDGAALPIWETWCGTQEAFGKTCDGTARPSRVFRNAHQLNPFATTGGNADDLRLAAFNKFDPSMTAYLAEQHAGPGNADYDYTQQSSLAQLNGAWPEGTSIADRKVQDTPYSSPPPPTAAWRRSNSNRCCSWSNRLG